jgi:hypothetical protein
MKLDRFRCRASGGGRFTRAGLLSALVLALSTTVAFAQEIRTASEQSDFSRFTSYPEMMDYLRQLKLSSLDMRMGTYGTTREGRELPYVIFSRPLVSQPWEAELLRRPVVVLAANVHGGERTFREGLLVLMRDLATRGTPANALLDNLVIIVAPQINPDGFHTGQPNPQTGIPSGLRGTQWEPDLNRDYVKLESPEIAGYIGNLVNKWHPHIFVDGHNGGAQPYNVNYQCGSSAAPDQRLTDICDLEIFPAINRALATENLKGFYYQYAGDSGGADERDDKIWTTGGFEARIGRNYGGFVNSIGILFEAPGGQNLRTGARTGYLAYKAVLDYARQSATKLMTAIQTARDETIRWGLNAEGDVPVRMRYGPDPRTVTWELVRDGGIVTVTSDSLMKKPVVLATRERPYAYVLPFFAEEAVAMLRRHNIVVEQLTEPTTLRVQAYTVKDVTYTTQYNHTAAVVVEVDQVVEREMQFAKGSYVVPTGQVLGRLVAHMLEVETDDNVIYWNTMDAWLPKPTARVAAETESTAAVTVGANAQQELPFVPIYKLMSPTPLPTKVMP